MHRSRRCGRWRGAAIGHGAVPRLAAFAQFGSELDKATQAQLARGQRLTEILKQNQYAPLTVEKQVLIIFVGTNGYMDDIAVADCKRFEQELYQLWIRARAVCWRGLRRRKRLMIELKADIIAAIQEFKEKFVPTGKAS